MMVAELITITSAARVTCVNMPDPMVETPKLKSARCDSGTDHRYQPSRKGMQTKEGSSHFALQRTSSVLSAGTASPSRRLVVTSAQIPANEAQTAILKNRLGKYVGLKNACQKRLAS